MVNCRKLIALQFVARESSHVLQSFQQLAPAIRERRRQRVSGQNRAKCAKAPAITPALYKGLQRFKQGFRGITAGAGNITFPFC
jgi:hypothetical protein